MMMLFVHFYWPDDQIIENTWHGLDYSCCISSVKHNNDVRSVEVILCWNQQTISTTTLTVCKRQIYLYQDDSAKPILKSFASMFVNGEKLMVYTAFNYP